MITAHGARNDKAVRREHAPCAAHLRGLIKAAPRPFQSAQADFVNTDGGFNPQNKFENRESSLTAADNES